MTFGYGTHILVPIRKASANTFMKLIFTFNRFQNISTFVNITKTFYNTFTTDVLTIFTSQVQFKDSFATTYLHGTLHINSTPDGSNPKYMRNLKYLQG